MALPFQGMKKADIVTGAISKIEIATYAASPSYLDIGDFTTPLIQVQGLTRPCDPSGSLLTYALKFSVSFQIVQTLKTAELAAMAGTSGTGVYETDVILKITYVSGRVLTLGNVAACPMRITLDYSNGDESGSQVIDVSGQTIEPITAFGAKVA